MKNAWQMRENRSLSKNMLEFWNCPHVFLFQHSSGKFGEKTVQKRTMQARISLCSFGEVGSERNDS